ncbi:hypothetical protein BJX63DRAFT_387138 [Aspergillus granulosus]|uniref:Uncharacterized protein n=1 Tax=Aspergillus granulosus TaxID=176169 RepID=A0ABR4HML2_9EURO
MDTEGPLKNDPCYLWGWRVRALVSDKSHWCCWSRGRSGSRPGPRSPRLATGQHCETVSFIHQLNKDYVKYPLLEDQAIYMNFFDWMYKTLRKKLL